jgi:hypothetical protein
MSRAEKRAVGTRGFGTIDDRPESVVSEPSAGYSQLRSPFLISA